MGKRKMAPVVLQSIMVLVTIVGVARPDNLALLSGTLRTFQKAACDGDTMTLRCPLGTAVSIQLAQYGRASAGVTLCPASVSVEPQPTGLEKFNETCSISQTMQYNLLQTVVEACMKKRQCKFSTSIRSAAEKDPCPHVSKFVEVAYKCRPSEFRSKVICQDESINLKCKPNARIAIYSANFGRAKYESLQCPQPYGVPEETCQTSFSTETVMQMCHGKRRCSLTASAETFGNPCSPQAKLYLQVVYTCVSTRILKDQYQGEIEDDERSVNPEEDDEESSFENEEMYESSQLPSHQATQTPIHQADSNFSPKMTRPTPKTESKTGRFFGSGNKEITGTLATTAETEMDVQSDVNVNNEARASVVKDGRVIGFISEWMSAVSFMRENQEKFILYLTLSIAAGILVFLSLLIGRLWWQKKRAHRDSKMNSMEPIPAFVDDFNDIDNDVDLSLVGPPVTDLGVSGPIPTYDGVRYSTVRNNTLRRQESDHNPSFMRNGNSHFYYG